MKRVTVETKNGGKVEIPVYETFAELQKIFKEEVLVRNYNRIIRIDLVNDANRKMSITAKLKRAVKEGKITEDKLVELLTAAGM